MNNDLFLGFTLSKLNNSYAESKNYEKWARLYVGHWAGQVYFRNFQKETGVMEFMILKQALRIKE